MPLPANLALYGALCHLLVVTALQLHLLLGMRRIRRVAAIDSVKGPLPSVSIVVAARNEERGIEAGLRSLMELDYSPAQLIVVNDRSTDRTGEIIDRVSLEDSRIVVIHLESLPEKWLGKNHALQCGAEVATSEYLLFTDADVVFRPRALVNTVVYAETHSLDHLAALPAFSMPTTLLESFATVFSIFFLTYFVPWRASDPRSAAHIGIGAFNLVRREVYEQIGRHEPIRMRPDDDIKLGKLIKNAGFRQELVLASSEIRVPWYATVREAVIGLEKNVLAGVDYRPSILLGNCVLVLAVFFWPFVAIWLLAGVARWLYVATAVILLLSTGKLALDLSAGGRFWCVLWYPMTLLLFVYVVVRNTILTYWRGGIRWRDQHYPLSQLRANKL